MSTLNPCADGIPVFKPCCHKRQHLAHTFFCPTCVKSWRKWKPSSLTCLCLHDIFHLCLLLLGKMAWWLQKAGLCASPEPCMGELSPAFVLDALESFLTPVISPSAGQACRIGSFLLIEVNDSGFDYFKYLIYIHKQLMLKIKEVLKLVCMCFTFQWGCSSTLCNFLNFFPLVVAKHAAIPELAPRNARKGLDNFSRIWVQFEVTWQPVGQPCDLGNHKLGQTGSSGLLWWTLNYRRGHICESCLSDTLCSCTGIPQILTQVDRLCKHRGFFVKPLFISGCGREHAWGLRRILQDVAALRPSSEAAAPGLTKQLSAGSRNWKKVALPPTLPACLCSLQGLKGDGLSHTETHNTEKPWAIPQHL